MVLSTREWGKGPAVVLLHGAPSPVDDFARVAARLEGTHRVLAPSMPGYGDSPRLDGAFSLARVRDAIVETLYAKGITECAVVGFSLGALQALALAADERLRVTSVVGLGAFASQPDEARGQLAGFAAMIRGGADLREPQWRAIAAARFTAKPELGDKVADWLLLAPPDVLADEIEGSAGADIRAILPTLRARVALRTGELDAATPPEGAREIVALCPHAELAIVPGVGHAQLLEDPEGTATFIARAVC